MSVLVLALSAAPVSIAVTEILLGVSLMIRLAAAWHGSRIVLPRAFWWWIPWAALEVTAWLRSPEWRAGTGEIRHLLLIAALFVLLPAMGRAPERMRAWKGIFLTSTVSSVVLIAVFAWRLQVYPSGADPVVYLRNGGLLHHWMIYGTVEVMVFAGLLAFWQYYPEQRRYWFPALAIAIVAIVLSLTRMLWICCLLLLAVHLMWQRSRWIWAVPAVPLLALLSAPPAVRARVADSSSPDYYSNLERIQMLRVGAAMIRSHPLGGVGPGRVERLYKSYLPAGDPIPAYYGHLHNNAAQLAAQFGVPAAAAAALFCAILFRNLLRLRRSAVTREQQFLSHAAVLGLIGFVAAGMFEYTYGHSLGLILLGFVVSVSGEPDRSDAISAADRVLGTAILVASLPVLVPAAATIMVLSRRSPLVAHLRVGQHGRRFWVLKLRTMWPCADPLPAERGWIQRIQADPEGDTKPRCDPRITSRFAAFCRRHSIDELPQLVHVVRGEMSLVGPRPVTRSELDKHYGVWSRIVLAVKPGLTGYWQTQGRNSLSYPHRVDLDLQLARQMSPRVYFGVLLQTVPEVLFGKNAR